MSKVLIKDIKAFIKGIIHTMPEGYKLNQQQHNKLVSYMDEFWDMDYPKNLNNIEYFIVSSHEKYKSPCLRMKLSNSRAWAVHINGFSKKRSCGKKQVFNKFVRELVAEDLSDYARQNPVEDIDYDEKYELDHIHPRFCDFVRDFYGEGNYSRLDNSKNQQFVKAHYNHYIVERNLQWLSTSEHLQKSKRQMREAKRKISK